ncbi:MAG: response regulator [Pseudomonadota bacterium]|nr:response regulator [Gammaproteobacteria bacterium]MDQ3582382.1 response regulator [Pseudomonadota bacterium]
MTAIEARGRPATVLFIEDSPSDVLMTREALDQAKVLIDLHVIDNGIDALAFLRRKGRYATAPRPDLILLDLNLPKKDGREVLREIKSDEALKRIPVVILTTSNAEEDVMRAYGLHANCYVTKPFDFEGLAKVVRSIERFWFTVVTLPKG